MRNMVTVKITEEARAMLRTLAAYYQLPMHEVAQTLFLLKVKQLDLRYGGNKTRRRGKQKGDK